MRPFTEQHARFVGHAARHAGAATLPQHDFLAGCEEWLWPVFVQRAGLAQKQHGLVAVDLARDFATEDGRAGIVDLPQQISHGIRGLGLPRSGTDGEEQLHRPCFVSITFCNAVGRLADVQCGLFGVLRIFHELSVIAVQRQRHFCDGARHGLGGHSERLGRIEKFARVRTGNEVGGDDVRDLELGVLKGLQLGPSFGKFFLLARPPKRLLQRLDFCLIQIEELLDFLLQPNQVV